jgi:hypothetical protein
MPESYGFDLAFRPAAYVAPPAAAARSPAEERLRTRILALLEDGDVAGLAALQGAEMNFFLDLVATERLSDRARTTAGRVHPAFMGGQYLPPLAENEQIIAEIHLASVTADVISVYARQETDRIVYTVVDEYDSDFAWSPEESTAPLTLGELVEMLDNIEMLGVSDFEGHIRWVRDNQMAKGRDPQKAADFVTVFSDFYPDLFDYFEAQAAAWLAEVTGES